MPSGQGLQSPAAPNSGPGQILWLASLLCVGVSSMMGSVNYITTIINLRAPGMTLYRMPMTVWALFITAILQAFALPVLTVALILQLLDKTAGTNFFQPSGSTFGNWDTTPGGGQPLLWQHLFWFYSHPAVYIMILPAMGMVSDIICTFARRPLFGYKAMILSIASIAGLGFIVWGHHMFNSGMDPRLGTAFMLATMMIALPSAVKVFNWLGTIYKGNLHLTAPMLFALAFVSLFIIGGLSGIFMAATPVDIFIHDTYFIVAHIHYVLFTSSLFGIFAAIYYWFPKMFGRHDERRAGQGALRALVRGRQLHVLSDAHSRHGRASPPHCRHHRDGVRKQSAAVESIHHHQRPGAGGGAADLHRQFLLEPVPRQTVRQQSVEQQHAGMDDDLARTARQLRGDAGGLSLAVRLSARWRDRSRTTRRRRRESRRRGSACNSIDAACGLALRLYERALSRKQPTREKMNNVGEQPMPSRWLAWWAWLTVAAVCPLLLLGAHVTTLGVGMADSRAVVSPMRAIYEYLGGEQALGWKLEHGHRLAGWFAGMCGIGLAIGFWFGGKRQGLRWLGLLGLALIALQGVLGIYRVQLNSILGPDLAWIHGCFAQIVFAVLVCVASAASSAAQAACHLATSAKPQAAVWSLACVALVLGQLILGGVIRHDPGNLLMARVHLLTAFVVTAGLLWLAKLAWDEKNVFGWSPWLLLGLLALQIVLGVETGIGWLARYYDSGMGIREGTWHLWIRTGHYFVGSLLFACTAVVALRARLPARSASDASAPSLALRAGEEGGAI